MALQTDGSSSGHQDPFSYVEQQTTVLSSTNTIPAEEPPANRGGPLFHFQSVQVWESNAKWLSAENAEASSVIPQNQTLPQPHRNDIPSSVSGKLIDVDGPDAIVLHDEESQAEEWTKDIQALDRLLAEKETNVAQARASLQERTQVAKNRLKESYETIFKKLLDAQRQEEDDLDRAMEPHTRSLDQLHSQIRSHAAQLTRYSHSIQRTLEEGRAPDNDIQARVLLLEEDLHNFGVEIGHILDSDSMQLDVGQNSNAGVLNECVRPGKRLHFLKTSTLLPRDIQLTLAPGNSLLTSHTVTIEVRSARSHKNLGELVFCELKDEFGTSVPKELLHRDSRCHLLTFVPRVSGVYKLEVTLYEEQVKNSPFTVKVEKGGDQTPTATPSLNQVPQPSNNEDLLGLTDAVSQLVTRSEREAGRRVWNYEDPGEDRRDSSFHGAGGDLPESGQKSQDAGSGQDFGGLQPYRFHNEVSDSGALVEAAGCTESTPSSSGSRQSIPGPPAAASGGGGGMEEAWTKKPDLGACLRRNNSREVKARCLFTIGLEYQSEGPRGTALNGPIGCAVLPSGNIIVCDTKHHVVKLYTRDGEPVRMIGLDKPVRLSLPSAVVVLPGPGGFKGTEFAVKDKHSITIFREEDPHYCRVIGRGQLNDVPYGLALTAGGHLVTVTSCNKIGETLYFFDPESGELVKEVNFDAPGHSASLRFMNASGDTLIISDIGTRGLGVSWVFLWSMSEERMVGRFGGRGMEGGRFSMPTGIQVDGGGNLLVGDAKPNDRVQIFDRKGGWLGNLRFDTNQGAPHVSDIELTEDGRILDTHASINWIFSENSAKFT